MTSATWATRIAEFILDCYSGTIPDDVLERAALQLLDSVVAAAGAVGAPPVEAAARVAEISTPGDATVLFRERGAHPLDAILVNGAAIRFLDVNDAFLSDSGPAGHPSDTIAVVLALAEHARSDGRALLATIAVAYELVWRLRRHIFRVMPDGERWDGSSVISVVSAATAALLLRARTEQLTNAICLGALSGYTLREVRGGEISMAKAVASAMAARYGTTAAFLALEDVTGPPLVFEGRHGLLQTLNGEASNELLSAVCAPAEWAIRRTSIKPRPGIGTSQAAVEAATRIAGRMPSKVSEIAEVVVAIPAGAWTDKHRAMGERRWPTSRESADHSIEFLVAIALIAGDIRPEHYERQLWNSQPTRDLMSRIRLIPDPTLRGRAAASFPATVEVILHDGTRYSEASLDPPGSPTNPWGRTELLSKFARLNRTALQERQMEQIADRILGLPTANSIQPLSELLRAPGL